MRGAGCTLNDILDRDIDGSVERTKSRPLPAGTVTLHQAVGWLGVQLAGGLGVLLSLPHPLPTFYAGLSSLPLFLLYPTSKRWTTHPQYVLALMINYGCIITPYCVLGHSAPSVTLPLYAAFAGWTVAYDTLYAHQDKEDDKRLNLGSTAIAFGEDGTRVRLLAATGIFGLGLTSFGVLNGLDGFAWYVSAFAATGWTAGIVAGADWRDEKDLGIRFNDFGKVGAVVVAGAAGTAAGF